MNISESDYHTHVEEMNGYCVNCKDFTRFGETEPDAENYPCDDCGEDSCLGAEQAMLLGHLEIEE